MKHAALSRSLGHFLPATVVSYTGGVTLIWLTHLAWRWLAGKPRKEWAEQHRQGRPQRPLSQLHWWNCVGGSLGCCTLVSSVAASSHLSYTAMATLGSLGGLLSSLLTDHVGLLGIPKRRLSPSRRLGALLVLGGCCGASLDMAASQATVQSTLNPVAVAALGLLYLATSLVQPVQSCLSFRREFRSNDSLRFYWAVAADGAAAASSGGVHAGPRRPPRRRRVL